MSFPIPVLEPYKAVSLPTKRAPKNIIGQRFGRLTVEAYAGRHGKNQFWFCRCVDGTVIRTRSDLLKSGITQSCGCLSVETAKLQHTTHGQTSSQEHYIWATMKSRCENPRNVQYHRYGAKGITVCERWRTSFEAFYLDMGPRPTPEHQLDRFPDRHGNYEVGNVRWATPSENNRNKDNNHLLTDGGITRCLTEWSQLTGIGVTTIRERKQRGWTDNAALTTPVQFHSKPKKG